MKQIFLFLFGGCFLFFAPAVSFAQSDCETAMITAFAFAEKEYETEISKFLENHNANIVSKTSGQNLQTYDRDYTCQLKSICAAANWKYNNKEIKTNFAYGCEPKSMQEIEEIFSTSFDSCEEGDLMGIRIENKLICEDHIKKSLQYSRNKVGEIIRKTASEETQGFIGTKLLSMLKKMQIFEEKTRNFSQNFRDVINDISCTIPDPSS